MGLLDRLFGRKSETAGDASGASGGSVSSGASAGTSAPPKAGQWQPHPVQQQLIEAIRGDRPQRLVELCEKHRDIIAASFSEWRRVPHEARGDEALKNAYVQAHVAVARCFANELGDPSLLQLLAGNPQDNPINNWRDQIERAQIAMDAGEYERARTLLQEVLKRMEGCEGSGVDKYRPTALSMLGLSRFELRYADKAVQPLTDALDAAKQAGDTRAEIAYTGNLYEVYRYLGQDQPASEHAAAMSDLMKAHGMPQARWFASQAKIVAKGEPLLRVVAVVEGVYHELKALPARLKDVKVQLVYQRNRRELKPCVDLCNRGQNLLNHQKFNEAIDALRRASDLDPYAPMPAYLAGVALLHMQQYDAAIDGFQEADRLAPGWYQNTSFLWLAQQMAAGRIDHDTFVALQMLESGMGNESERQNLAEAAISRNAIVPSLYLQHAIVLEELGRKDEALQACKRGLDAARDEPDAGSRLLLRMAQMAELNSDEQFDLYDRVTKVKRGHLIAKATAKIAMCTIGEHSEQQ